MKTIKLIIILIVAFGNYHYLFPCDLPYPGCENEKFPYLFCNSNNFITKCSSNPYNEYDGNTQLTPMKLSGCFIYDPISYHLGYITVEHHDGVVHHSNSHAVQDENGNYYYGIYDSNNPIYDPVTHEEITTYNDGDYIDISYDTHDGYYTTDDPCNEIYNDFWGNPAFNLDRNETGVNYSDVNDDFNNALTAWSNNCAPPCILNQQYIQTCCVHVSWTMDRQEFLRFSSEGTEDGPKKVRAYTQQKIDPGSMTPCKYDCESESTFVHINQTNDFTGASYDDPCNYNYNFFITGSTTKSDWWSLTAVFMHEMGHLFGFGDEYDNGQDNGQVYDTHLCWHTGSIMGNDGFTNPDRGFDDQNYDKCMYMKMYCWTPPPNVVEENQETIEGIKIFPNPTNKDLINVQFGNPSGVYMTYKIISPIGNTVLAGDIQPNENPKTIILDNLSSGVYFIILKHGVNQEIQKFVIDK